ncbi:hypothetical protein DRR62_26270 [Escherichia coli]|nr:hypothetical protein [Escherichia coli]EFI4101748.1 hypothetical protein [Escherichia coli]EFO2385784.1 hypothetical protein [Escherichia coli]TJB42492.1 hypothetical protein C9296_22530 [Escherichia coli]TJF13304.1 hypothetical protein C9199_22465 [Escherichia coli]
MSYDSQSYDSLELYIYRSRRRKLFPIFVNFQIYRLKQVSDMKALLITAWYDRGANQCDLYLAITSI